MAPAPQPSRNVRFPPALTVLMIGLVLFFAREVLIPIALAVLLTFLLVPIVRRLERRRVPRFAAVGLAVGFTSLGVAGVCWLIQGQVLELAANLPQYKENIRAKLHTLRPSDNGVLDKAGDTLKELQEEITGKPDAEPVAGVIATNGAPTPVRVVDSPTPPLTYLKTMLGPLLSRVATAGIVVVFAIFMLMKREDLRNRLLWLIGERSMHVATPAFDDAAQRVSSYLLMQTLANTSAGVAAGMGLFFLGIPNALVWGLLVALFRYIPYVGTLLAGVLPFAMSVAIAPDWTQPLMVVGLIIVVEVIIGNVVEPLLYGSKTGLSPIAILAAAVFWAWLWGPVGLLLATPLTVCLAVIGRHVPELAFLHALLGDEPVLSPQSSFYQRLLAGDQEEAGRIVDSFSKDKDLVEVYDALFLPAMRLAESDRLRGVLGDEQAQSILDMLSMMIEDTGASLTTSQPPSDIGVVDVVCLPARDKTDELAARMLAHLLTVSSIRTHVIPADALSGETMEKLECWKPSLVCISSVPPAAALHGRVQSKRLRMRFRELPLVLGVWDADADPQLEGMRLGAVGLEFVVTTLKQATEQIKTLSRTVGSAPIREPEVVTMLKPHPPLATGA